MRAAIFSAAIALAPCASHAEATLQELCTVIGSSAEAIMTGRQNNVAMSELMGKITGMEEDHPVTIMMRQAVIEAYKIPLWRVPENKAESIKEFRSQMELRCYTEFAGAK